MYIGDIYLPILSNIDKKSVSKITKEIAGINAKEPRTVSIRRNLQPITLEGYLYNDGEKDDAQYAEDVEALQYRSAGYCYTKYADLDGFIEIENAEAPQTSEELGVRNYSVEGKYLPASKYERVVEVETEMRENEFNIEFPPHVALPVGATNVRVKTSQDSVKLSAPAFMAGDIPIYRPFPAFYPDDVTHSDSDAPQYDATAYKLTYNLLDAEDESISYTMVSGIDIPLGSYRVVLRIKEDSVVTGDVKITVSDGTTNVVDSLHTLVGDGVWNIVKTASFSILQKGLTYTITVTKAEDDATNIAVNYGFLLPEKRARVAFDVAAEYDVGECKVFDTITTDSEESTWIQVFNPEHDFAGDIVVQNSMFRWVIKQTAWKDATKVYNISGSAPVEIGKLYNKAFGDDSVAIKFKEIKPNYLKFTFELDTGNATSESTSAKENDTVEITPFNVVIDKDVIGAYKDHYTFESTPSVNVEYENGIIAGIDSNSVYGLIKSVNVTSSYDGDIIETTGSESSDSYVVPFVIPCEITNYLYKQAVDLVISKDNNDIERKFWKDDFSVDSSSQYTGDVESFTWDTENKEVNLVAGASYSYKTLISNYTHNLGGGVKISFSLKNNNTSSVYQGGIIIGTANGESYRCTIVQHGTISIVYVMAGTSFISGATLGQRSNYNVSDGEYHRYELTISSDGVARCTIDGIRTAGGYTLPTSIQINPGPYEGAALNSTVYWKDFSVAPSESYSDDFATDTVSGANGRYVMVWESQDITSSITHDTDHIVIPFVTDGLGNNRVFTLKSYKFTEGEFYFEITPPATPTEGERYGMLINGSKVGGTDPGDLIEMLYTEGKWYAQFTTRKSSWTKTPDVSEELTGFTGGVLTKFKIQLDPNHGVGYASIWQGVSEPTYPTLKFYYVSKIDGNPFRLVLMNSTESTCNLSNIKIRAESIVGRTNVEVTEPFWFRDEFGEDSLGRYIKSNTTISEGKLSIPGRRHVRIPALKLTGNSTVELLVESPTSAAANYICYIDPNATINQLDGDNIFTTDTGLIYIAQFANRIEVYVNNTMIITDADFKRPDNVQTLMRVTYNGTDSITFSNGVLTKTYTDSRLNIRSVYGVALASGPGSVLVSSGLAMRWDNLQISGTRVYNKPIHRGAMLETYHDGTQEVVGTTFIDDCQWDRSGEYTTTGSIVRDITNGTILCSSTGVLTSKANSFGEGLYYVRCANPSNGEDLVLFSNKYTNPAKIHFYRNLSNDDGEISIYVGGSITSRINLIGKQTLGIWILLVGTTLTMWFDSDNVSAGHVSRSIVTVSGFSPDYLLNRFEMPSGSSISKIQIIAASSDATNGIAACIPPIGGGARYGVEESVYNTFTTENVNKGVYLTTAKVKTTNPNADEVSLECTNDTTSITLNTTPIDVDTTYTVKTTPITIDANETDTLRVSVKNSTTCVQSTNYVDSLSMIPVSGDDVLYPQDLAFISGVKPSQKRKVEVK